MDVERKMVKLREVSVGNASEALKKVDQFPSIIEEREMKRKSNQRLMKLIAATSLISGAVTFGMLAQTGLSMALLGNPVFIVHAAVFAATTLVCAIYGVSKIVEKCKNSNANSKIEGILGDANTLQASKLKL
jgi:hypothetical protein